MTKEKKTCRIRTINLEMHGKTKEGVQNEKILERIGGSGGLWNVDFWSGI